MKLRDLTGVQFGRLTALQRVANRPGYGQARWLFKCSCGREIEAFGYNVAHGRQQSCGCIQKEAPHPMLRHGKTGQRIHHIWAGMRQRCGNPNAPAYAEYGGRGIMVCERWESFDNFLADMGEPREGESIERIDNNGGYGPSNCRWATRTDQVRNRRTSTMYEHDGRTLNLADWADIYGLPYKVVWHRFNIGDRGDRLFRALRAMKRRQPKA